MDGDVVVETPARVKKARCVAGLSRFMKQVAQRIVPASF
jgi:hypothetical protein